MALSLQPYTKSSMKTGLNLMLKKRAERERKRFMAIKMTNGDCLPEILIVEILSWLPVKALLQFKSVCKSWYDIIKSSHFISKHLQNYYNNNESWRSCLLAQYWISHGELQVHEVLVEKTFKVLSYETLYNMPMYGSYICGPCDGIYFLHDWCPITYARALWNPALNELKGLPPIISKPNLPSNLAYVEDDVYGFGLDPITKDYKVVVIKRYKSLTDEYSETEHPLSIFIYSLGNDSWSYWGDLDKYYYLKNNPCYICVNGGFYWLGSHKKYDETSVMISFNMSTQSVQNFQVPDDDGKPAASTRLGVYHDSIALFTDNENENENRLVIWTLDQGFWTKKLTVELPSPVQELIGHWKDNKFLLECGGLLVLCDLDKQEIKDVAFGDYFSSSCCGIYAYMESLVSIGGKRAIEWQH